MDSLKLNPVQKAAFSLIQQDLRYIYTVIKNINSKVSNYIPSMLPYLGVVIDGAEDWLKAIKNSSKCKFCMPLFNESQTIFYEQIRNSIKMWQQDYNEIYISLGNAYSKSDDYFGSVCKPIAKVLKLYDIYGMDTINGVICGNTILCHCYSPFFSYSENNGEYIKVMSEIGGRYINLFHATTDFQVNNELQFGVQDYGGFIKSPVGNVYSDKFVLMSILCQINFLLYGIEKWINNEIPTKLRFGYLLYYSLISVIEQINQKLGIALKINSKWKSDRFRNSMAHYKLGIVLKESNLIISDAMFGLTEKIFGEDYYTIKKSIYKELEKLAKQIGAYLDLPQRMVYLQYERSSTPTFYYVSTTITVHILQNFAKICILCTEMTNT